MSDLEPTEDHRAASFADGIKDRRSPRARPIGADPALATSMTETVSFNGAELREILNLFGRKVAEGEWRDYAIDFTVQKAVFSIYRRASECALYRIEKTPKLAKKQGAYCVVTTAGLVLRRGHDLRRVIGVLDKRLKLVSG